MRLRSAMRTLRVPPKLRRYDGTISSTLDVLAEDVRTLTERYFSAKFDDTDGAP